MPNIIMADEKGGSPVSWGSFHTERVTAGENSASNFINAYSYVAGLRQNTTGKVIAIKRITDESPSPANNEFCGLFAENLTEFSINYAGFLGDGWRYKNGSYQQASQVTSNYDAVITSGSVFDVVSVAWDTSFT